MTYTYLIEVPLERGTHNINTQVTNPWQTVTSDVLQYQMAYELVGHGIDLYVGDRKVDAWDINLQDATLPQLPTLDFTSAAELASVITAIVRERGLRTYQFEIRWVDLKNGVYQYKAVSREEYALNVPFQTLKIPYSTTANLIGTVAPQLFTVGASLLTSMVQAQQFANVRPVDIISQMLIQNKAQGHVRDGKLYVSSLDVSALSPMYYLRRIDPLTAWSRDADIYDKVRAFYTVKQYPIPDTVLTNHDAINWTGTVSNVSVVGTSLLPPPSGASEMLKSNGNCSRTGLSARLNNFDRVRFNWNPATATSVTVSLQQDGANKLEYVKAFSAGTGSGFTVLGTGPDAIATKDIAIGGKNVTQIHGFTTRPCSYRGILLDAGAAVIWTSDWLTTGFGGLFQVDVPASIYENWSATTARLEFKGLYVVSTGYGVQATQYDVQIREQVAGTTAIRGIIASKTFRGDLVQQVSTDSAFALFQADLGTILDLQTDWAYQIDSNPNFQARWGQLYGTVPGNVSIVSGHVIASYTWYRPADDPNGLTCPAWVGPVDVTITILGPIISYDLMWQTSPMAGLTDFNLWESVDIPASLMTRTGNPQTLNTIAFTFSGDNYLDGICLVASDSQPQYVEVGTGKRTYPVNEDLGSLEGALSYARGLYPIVSTAREQYTRDLLLSDDIGVGDTVDCDGVNMTVYSCEYRQDGKTIAAGKQLDTAKTRLQEQSRRIDALERR